jgi:hypothetical protein
MRCPNQKIRHLLLLVLRRTSNDFASPKGLAKIRSESGHGECQAATFRFQITTTLTDGAGPDRGHCNSKSWAARMTIDKFEVIAFRINATMHELPVKHFDESRPSLRKIDSNVVELLNIMLVSQL